MALLLPWLIVLRQRTAILSFKVQEDSKPAGTVKVPLRFRPKIYDKWIDPTDIAVNTKITSSFNGEHLQQIYNDWSRIHKQHTRGLDGY